MSLLGGRSRSWEEKEQAGARAEINRIMQEQGQVLARREKQEGRVKGACRSKSSDEQEQAGTGVGLS